MEEEPLPRLQRAVSELRETLRAYEQPSEPVAFEVLRSIDDIYLRDLLLGPPRDSAERMERQVAGWGVNNALARILPQALVPQPFKHFPSSPGYQSAADDFLLACGSLHLGEQFEGWLRHGIVSGELLGGDGPEGPFELLVLRSSVPSHSDEEVGRAGMRWASEISRARSLGKERRLLDQHRKLLPDLDRRSELIDGWRVAYTSSPQLEDYFLEWARLYLQRIPSSDLMGPDDPIGGRPFSRYLEVLTALSGRAHRHLAFAQALMRRHPGAELRNMLTGHAPRTAFIAALSERLDAGYREIEEILESFILTPQSLSGHLELSSTIWAPAVQASEDTLLLPMYGLDIDPFSFMFHDFRRRHATEWFDAANRRERRWVDELQALFRGPRWLTNIRNLRLRENGQDVTDIDFAVADRKRGDVALFQLKWQHSVGVADKSLRSAGRNLLDDSNKWLADVSGWLDRHGADELMRRLGFADVRSPHIHFFVLGRYHAYLTDYDLRDERAVWSDWAHFRRARQENPRHDLARTASDLRSKIKRALSTKSGVAALLPLRDDFAVAVNPRRVDEK